MLKKSRAVLFDMDGVLVRTEHLKAEAHSATVKRFGGAEIPISFYAEVLGQSHEQVRSAYFEAGGIDTDPKAYTRVYREIRRELLRTDLEVAEGVERLLQQLFREGYALAVVSSSDSQVVNQILSQTHLAEYFDVVVSADDVGKNKPAPDAYLLALERLVVPSTAAVVIEDSQVGIQAAIAAGIPALAVRHSLNIHQDLAQAHAVFDSLRDSHRVMQTIDALLNSGRASQGKEIRR